MPATILTRDSGQTWLANAIPMVLQQDLATSESLITSLVPNSSAAYQVAATQIVRSLVEQRNGRLRVQATVCSLDSQQNVTVLWEDGPVKAGIIPILDALAKKIDSARAGRFSTRSEAALKTFSAALETRDMAARSQLLDTTVQEDPAFGLAHIARVENTPQNVSMSSISDGAFVPLDRARWIALSSRRHNAPLDAQASTMANIIRLAPNNVEAVSALGTMRFLQGNATAGEHLLQRAIDRNPTNAAFSLQMAQGLVAVGQFSSAIRTLRALSTANPNLLPSLALVELLNGNPAEADHAFRKFTSLLPKGNPAIPALQAQWQRFRDPGNQIAPAESVEHWRSLVQQSGDQNLATRAMLAAVLQSAGRTQEARGLNVLPFIPDFADPNAPIAFNTMRLLRSSR